MSTRTFCCCIPVRIGVMLVSILSFALGLLITIGGIYEVVNIPSDGTAADKASYVIIIVIYGLLALMSFLGFIGALARVRALILALFTVLTGHLLLNLAIGIWFLVTLYKNTSTIIDSCVNTGATDPDGNPITIDPSVCQTTATVYKAVATTFLVLVWLLELSFISITNDYAKQLQDEQSGRMHMNNVRNGSADEIEQEKLRRTNGTTALV